MISEPPVNYSSHHSLVHRFSLAVFFLIAVTFAGCAHSEVTAQTSQQPPPPPPPLTFLAEWGTHGHEPGELGHPEWLTTDFTGNAFIADSGTGNIEKFGPTGHPLLSFDDRVPDDPFRVAVDPGAGIYVLSPNANSIFIFSPEGEPFRHLLLTPLKAHQRPESIAVDVAGDIFVIVTVGKSGGKSDSEQNEIREYNARGRFLKTLVPVLVSGKPFVPASLAAGPDGNLYVLDVSSSRVQKFTLDGDYVTAWGDAPDSNGDSAPAGSGIGVTSKYVFTPDSAIRGVKVWTSDGQLKFADPLENRLQNGTGRFQIAVSNRGELLVLDVAGTRVLRFRINF
ncbi:MAG: NHL repeat-containing protein [Candidatus Acidiferrales bacterium]